MFDNEAASNKLMELFENNLKEIEGQHLVSELGLTKMGDVFESVPLDSRADVFISFLDMLHEEGYDFNIEQFSQVNNAIDPELTLYDEQLEDIIRYENEGGVYN